MPSPSRPPSPDRLLLVEGPCRLRGTAARALDLAAERLAAPVVRGAEAAAVEETLAAGGTVHLANGPWLSGYVAGDPFVGEWLARVQGPPRGTIVGAFSHGHALFELKLRFPELETRVAAPIAEVLATGTESSLVEDGLRDVIEGPRRYVVAATHARVGPALPVSRDGVLFPLPPEQQVEPRAVRTGTAEGIVAAGNLVPLAVAAGRWRRDVFEGAILLLETASLPVRVGDRYLQRLVQLGVVARLGALLLSVPVAPIHRRTALDWETVLARTTQGTDVVAAVDAFVGTGLPAPSLALGAPARVTVEEGRVTLSCARRWNPTDSSR